MTEREALKLALKALELAKDNLRDHGDNCFLHDEGEYNRCFCGKDSLSDHLQSVVEKLDEALAQPEPWEKFCDSNCVWTDHHPDCKLAQRLPLTDEEIVLIVADCASSHQHTDIHFARAIEAAHGIKGEA